MRLLIESGRLKIVTS